MPVKFGVVSFLLCLGSLAFAVAPSITSFSPTCGPVGTVVTVNGNYLATAPTVSINGMTQTVNVTQIALTIVSGTSTGPIVVTTAGGTATSATNFTVTLPLTAVSVTASPVSPQSVNQPVTFTASTTGGANVQYQFWRYAPTASPAWTQLQGFSSSPTCTWTPTAVGNYMLSVTAMDGVTGAQVNTTLWNSVLVNPLIAFSVSASPASPQPSGSTITVTATTTGGTNVQYQYWLYCAASSPAWSQLQGFSTSSTSLWKPGAAGDYMLSVTAYDSSNGIYLYDTLWYTVTASTGTNNVDNAAMVWVPGGSFTMGSELAGDSASNAGDGSPTTQQVTLTGYWIYKNEVTVADYRAFCAATGHPLPAYPSGYPLGCCWRRYSDWTGAALQQMPIVDVTWDDAQAYAAWAGVQLPSEAQYEYAARGPQENNYTWGGTATVAGNYIDGWDQTKCANWDNSSSQGTWPVGSFPQDNSWCGASDLAGNVMEWCSDWYGDYSSTPVTNPTGPATGGLRVLRGGTWYMNFEYLYLVPIVSRGAFRNGDDPKNFLNYAGFRCVANPLSALSVSASPASSQAAGLPVTFTATATGGANVQYQFWLYNPSANPVWSQLQGYSSSSTYTWTPTAAGNAMISVSAQDGLTGAVVNTTLWYTVTPGAGTPGTNPTDGADMVWVPGSSFTMGSALPGDSASDAGDGSPTTQQVTLTGYWLYRDEVTVAEYLAFCAATGHTLPTFISSGGDCWGNYSDWTGVGLQQMPIVNVTWYDAEAYADWAGVKMPTEAQYEYAVRGPQENNYPWGDTATVAGNYIDGWDDSMCADWDNSSTQGTWPVESFPQGNSWCGASDLAGNVWEWCADWYGDYSSTPVTNPTGPATGSERVLRGGSWYVGNALDYRGAYRLHYDQDKGYYNAGFRCVSLSPGP